MNSQQFVSALVEHVHKPAIEDTLSELESPSGRKPPRNIVNAARWYAGLSQQDRASLKSVVELAVHGTLFGFLCTLDGVRAVQDNPQHEFHLSSVEGGASTRLNTPEGEPLHDTYQGLIYSKVFE
jgi:hypothetical protein